MSGVRRNDFNNELKHGKRIFYSCSGANTKRLHHYIIRASVDGHPDTVLIHVGTTDIINGENHIDIANNIIEIVKTAEHMVSMIYSFSQCIL